MSSATRNVHLPLFLLQLPQKTLARFGLGMENWQELMEWFLDIDIRNSSVLDTFIDFEDYRQILQLTMHLFGRDKMLQMYIGDASFHHLGPIGAASATAPTAGAALDLWLENSPVLAPTLKVSRRADGSDTVITFQQTLDMGAVADHYLEIVLFLSAKLLRETSNDRARITLSFTHPAAFPTGYYESSFGLTPRFSSTETSLRVDSEALAMVNDEYGPLLHQQALAECRVLAGNARNHASTSHRVRQILLEGSGQNHFYSLEDVAGKMHLSVRTLTRRLQGESTGFREIQCEARLELAKRQLRQSRLPIKTICTNAGFTNLSAFSRAFRKYAHSSPSEYRDGIAVPAAEPAPETTPPTPGPHLH